MRRRVLADASVLYPNAQRNILFRLADSGFFEVRWSSAIIAEFRRNILTEQPELQSRNLERSIELMRDMFPQADVLDYEAELARVPDHVRDPHVLAAAIAARVDAVVTADRRRITPEPFSSAGIAVLSLDMLLCQCLDEDSRLVEQLLIEEGAQKGISLIEVLSAVSSQAPDFVERSAASLLSQGSNTQFDRADSGGG
jgi:predicted nucleic acid-binding protein